MRRFSITDKLIIAAVLLSGLIIIIVASYSFYKAKEAVIERSFNQLNSVRVVKTNLIEGFFLNSIDEVELTSSSKDIREIVFQLNQLQGDSVYRFVDSKDFKSESYFINRISNDYHGHIFIIGKNKLIYSIKQTDSTDKYLDYAKLWSNTGNKKAVLIKDFELINDSSFLPIVISSNIYDTHNEKVGVIVFEVLSKAIDSIMLNSEVSNGLGTSGESYLVGFDYLMRSSSRFQPKSVMVTKVKTDAVDSVFAQKCGINQIKDYRNIEVLSSYSRIKVAGLNWAVLAEIDYDEVVIPVVRNRNEIIFISIFIFLIVIIVVIVFSRKITFPIQKLNQAAHEVAIGNLELEIKSSSDDEIGELTDTFNHMIVKLREQSEELELEKVKSLRSLIDGQERERQRLSRELHDSLGQILIGLKLKYESCINHSNMRTQEYDDLGLLFDQTIEETRRISNNLMPSALSEFGLTTAIRYICNEFSEISSVQVFFNSEGSSKDLNTETRIYIFRIIQEALTNIIKHSKAKKARIKIVFEKDIIFVSIKDDGIGFDLAKAKLKKSNGLNNIYERVDLLTGRITINTEVNKGTEIIMEIPV